MVLTFVGMLLFFLDDLGGGDNAFGIILALLGGVVLTGLLISQKLNHPDYQPGAVFWGNILVCALMSPWALSEPFPAYDQNLLLLALGFGQLGLGFALFVKGQKYLSAIESALISMLEPVLNPIWVMIGYGEIPGFYPVLGGTIILLTLLVRIFYLEYYQKKIKEASNNL